MRICNQLVEAQSNGVKAQLARLSEVVLYETVCSYFAVQHLRQCIVGGQNASRMPYITLIY